MSDYLVSLPLTDVKNYLNLSNTTEAVDTWLTREVRTQMQAIEKYLDRPIVVQQFREDMDGTGEYRMNLTYTPVLSVLTLNVDNFRYFRDNTEIDASQFLLLDDACLELEHDYFPYGTKNVRVSYIAGFAEIEVPFARQRFDIRETDSGNLLTAYLPAGRYENANDVVTSLQEALNAVGDDEKVVAFDWIQRKFTITTDGDYLQVVTAESGEFEAAASATGLLGWTADTTLSDDKVVSGVVNLSMPEPVRTAALTLIATEYRRGTLGDNRYGVRSRRLGDFQEAFTETNGGSALNVSMEMRNELDRYKNWKLF